MRFIPTRVHGLLDYAVGMLLLASPWMFQFDHGSVETWLPIVLGAGMMSYSMFTDYEWSVARRIPMPIHLLLDGIGGLLLAVSPWLFGFAHAVYAPHLAMGVGEMVVALFTSTRSTDRSVSGVKRMTGIIIATALWQTSCQPADSSTYIVTTVAAQRLEITPVAKMFTTISGFHEPESVLYDAEQDVFFVSNMHGAGSDKDGIGYIVRVSASDYADAKVFIESGRGGVTLDAPKGMALRDSILWVADIEVIRGFDKRTGKPAGMIDLRPQGAILLNDIAAGPNGSLYATDSAILMTEKGTIYQNGDRIFAISPDDSVSVVAQGEHLKTPNGIKWDAANKRWIVAAFDPFESLIYALPAGPGRAPQIIARGHGNFDGVEILEDGSIVVTSWADYSLHMIRDGKHLRIAGNIHQPADLGVDTRRNRLLVPSVILGRVEVWQLK
jgi:sugar lactone lactonase YvrE